MTGKTTGSKWLFAGVMALALGACAAPQKTSELDGFKRMKGADIVASLVGNSLDGEDKDGDYVIYYDTPTTMKIVYQGRTESGVWRIKGDRYCRRWQTFGKGKERCVHFYRSGDRINWVRKGKIRDRSVLVAGNPAAL